MTHIEIENWKSAVANLKAEKFEIYIAVDQLKTNRIELHLLTQKQTHIFTSVPRNENQIVPSITDTFPAALQSEREISEGFGVTFDNEKSNEPLLLTNSDALSLHPMRRDVSLKHRNETPWPGAKEPSNEKASPSRRKSLPIGAAPDSDKTV
ncbi:MAG: hypothetical protein RLZZ330_1235 [Actinomycetota bacterium]|jgi:NADH:ubiquinone oxidoreductase subunit C